MKNLLIPSLLTAAFLLAACGPSASEQATGTAIVMTATALSWTHTPSLTPTFTFTSTATPTSTITPTSTSTPTETLTPTPSETPTDTPTSTRTPKPTLTPSPTFDFPKLMVNKTAHCRYGPATAYLHAADLYAGDKGVVWGRYVNSNWLWVKMDKLSYSCWLAPSVVDVSGDVKRVGYVNVKLPMSVLYDPPDGVRAVRKGDKVTVTWNSNYETADDDRGYLLDVFVCQNGLYIWSPVSLPDQYHTSYTFTDQAGCGQSSGGTLASVEKHGYTTAVDIPWPEAR